MKERDLVNLLWADDDSDLMLEPLGRRLIRHGFVLDKAKTYTEALDRLRDGKVESTLVDIILPYSSGGGALGYDLGLALGERAAAQGVRAVVFLTVVPLLEVSEKYGELIKKYPQVRFAYFDKTLLLEPNTIEVLAESLRLPR